MVSAYFPAPLPYELQTTGIMVELDIGLGVIHWLYERGRWNVCLQKSRMHYGRIGIFSFKHLRCGDLKVQTALRQSL